jgi:hypothetical protein
MREKKLLKRLFLSGSFEFIAIPVIPDFFTAIAGFYQKMLVGTAFHQALLSVGFVANEGIFSGNGGLANVDIAFSFHHLLLSPRIHKLL